MSFGTVAYKVGGARQCSSMRKEVSKATLLVAPTRHRHTELFSGILTNQYILGPELGRAGKKNTAQKMASTQQSYSEDTL